MPDETAIPKPKSNFVREIIDQHSPPAASPVHTRFPPEPTATSHRPRQVLHLNFGLARDYRGLCNLRMDDTNPETEDLSYVDASRRTCAGSASTGRTASTTLPTTTSSSTTTPSSSSRRASPTSATSPSTRSASTAAR